ncbi:hypothetical protein [Streptomyces niger]|uniref:hypothetical protein n=1 Tax=Streptomyces niger TaxID=66373 RepID=UPI00069C37F6|nr:hypothetical protein [Streptomyces niger]
MEPIAPALLMALAGGTAGAAGQQLWYSLRDLIRRRPTGSEPHGEDELTALDETSEDTQRAQELSQTLALRAQQDPAFAQALQAWRRQAEALPAIRTGSGDVHNQIPGTVYGTVVQARDINGPLNFGR